jgi:hypothetical protein
VVVKLYNLVVAAVEIFFGLFGLAYFGVSSFEDFVDELLD